MTKGASQTDDAQGLAFCDDRTMWIGSWGHGIARRDPSGNVTTMSLPSGAQHPGRSLGEPAHPYFAHVQSTDSKGQVTPGGISAYAGP